VSARPADRPGFLAKACARRTRRAKPVLAWLADWPNDEHPYQLRTAPSIVSVPVAAELDDAQFMWGEADPRPGSGRRWSASGGTPGAGRRLGGGALPAARPASLAGRQPHRIRYLEEALDAVLAAAPWCATAGEIAAAAAPQLPELS
jgi:hypothetical protein